MLKKMIQTGGFLGLLFATALSYANVQQVLCPSLDKVRGSADKLTDVFELDSNLYAAQTANYAFTDSKLYWWVQVYNVSAADEKDALKNAKNGVKSLSLTQSKYAQQWDEHTYQCSYGPTTVILWGTDSPAPPSVRHNVALA